MTTKHPELLPALLSALHMGDLHQAHPEGAEIARDLFGLNIAGELNDISRAISMGDFDGPAIVREVARIERCLARLVPAGHGWN
jgi:hypothetical protein